MPRVVNDVNAEKIANNYLLKNYNLILDVPNLSVYPDYKFNIKIKADSLSLKHSNNKEFVYALNPDIEINLLSLIAKNIDLNNVKAKSVVIDANFTKNNRYDCFKYFEKRKDDLEKTKFRLRYINIDVKKFAFNLFDENIRKSFYLKSDDLKVQSDEFKKQILIKTNGVVLSSQHKISDFDLKLIVKTGFNPTGAFREKLYNLNYNPFYYADEYKFYAKSSVDLKINSQDKKSNIVGNIFLKDYNFVFEDLAMPKNNLLLTFKDNKVG